nr:PREDICTED: uncharacterized protein LOC107398352 isoform X2 [Tribolium castaneum]|eukprot:XP_015837653.1 PREDICTED: uncharacterized protein LOC107398352 isoform X2 [Tribolium castaneum]
MTTFLRFSVLSLEGQNGQTDTENLHFRRSLQANVNRIKELIRHNRHMPTLGIAGISEGSARCGELELHET